mmetsp:Transcript_10564/g.22520  ORF Transcript_10564/g.22520 Transcript_10564/m.22520 type:complete len:412 (+) Transcript_10564:1084-2319(+)
MEGAVHGFDLILFVLDLHLIEHSLFVEVEVSGSFPQVEIGDVRCVDDVVILVNVLLLPKVFDFTSDGGAFGVPEDESSSGVFLNRKKIQLLPQSPMIPLLRLFQHPLILLQLLRILPRRGINPLQHLPLLIAPPIRPGHALQLNRLLGQLPRALDVRSGAEIPPFLPNGINGNGLCFDGIQYLELERLADRLDHFPGLVPRHLLPNDGIILGDDLVHLLLDELEVRLGQFSGRDGFSGGRVGRFGEVEVVVEAVVDPGADGDLGFGEGLLDGHGHDVGGGVAEFEEGGVRVVGGEIFVLVIVFLGGGGLFFGYGGQEAGGRGDGGRRGGYRGREEATDDVRFGGMFGRHGEGILGDAMDGGEMTGAAARGRDECRCGPGKSGREKGGHDDIASDLHFDASNWAMRGSCWVG